MGFCLGRMAKPITSKVPLLRAVLPIINTPPPVATYWRERVSFWPMLANDSIGDCVIAGCLHYVQAITANANTQILPDKDTAISDYSTVGAATNGGGYDPKTGANDDGLVIDNALAYWMKTGLAVQQNGELNQLAGQARIEVQDIEMLKLGASEFCGFIAGVNLPTTAQGELEQGLPWQSTVAAPGGWGRHCIYCIDYDSNWIYAITWGRVQKISWAWWQKYADEAAVLLDRDWINSRTQLAPSNMTLSSLDERIENLRGVLGVNSK